MYHKASSKRSKRGKFILNLVPILDVIFIFVFFLLLSSEFVKLFVNDASMAEVTRKTSKDLDEPPEQFRMKITNNRISIYSGFPAKVIKSFKFNEKSETFFTSLNEYLGQLKNKHPDEKQIILVPSQDVRFQDLISIMDSVRFYKTKFLFSEIVFQDKII